MAHKMSFPVVDDVCAKFKMGSSLPRGKNGAGRAQKMSQIADRTFVDVEEHLIPAFRRLAAQSSFGSFIRFPLCVSPLPLSSLPNPSFSIVLNSSRPSTLPSVSQPRSVYHSKRHVRLRPITIHKCTCKVELPATLTAHHSSSNPQRFRKACDPPQCRPSDPHSPPCPLTSPYPPEGRNGRLSLWAPSTFIESTSLPLQS